MERQITMTENEFILLADTLFLRIENALDLTNIECSLNNGVLEIELEDETKMIINRHTPNQEIWVAAKSGGFHYHLLNGQWINKRDGSELFSKLSELCLHPV